MSAASKEEIEADLKELTFLQSAAKRFRTKKLVDEELQKCKKLLECINLLEMDSARLGGSEEKEQSLSVPSKSDAPQLSEVVKQELSSDNSSVKDAPQQAKTSAKTPTSKESTANASGVRSETIKDYGWTQSAEHVKLYVTVKGLTVKDSSKVSCKFTAITCNLNVKLKGKKFSLVINNLAMRIVPNKSSYKAKKDEVLVTLHKEQRDETWLAVTAVEAAMLMKNSQNNSEIFYGEEGQKEFVKKGEFERNLVRKSTAHMQAQAANGTNTELQHSITVQAAGNGGVLKSEMMAKPGMSFGKKNRTGWMEWVVNDSEAALKTANCLDVGHSPDKVYVGSFEDDSTFAVANYTQLLTKVANYDTEVHLCMYNMFWLRCINTKENTTACLEALELPNFILKCNVIQLVGHLSCEAIRRIPKGLVEYLGVAITSSEEFDAVQTLSLQHTVLEICIARDLDMNRCSRLKPWGTDVFFHFYGLKDSEQEWLMIVLHKLTGGRNCSVVLPDSELSVSGCRVLARRFAAVKVSALQIDAHRVPDSDRMEIQAMFVKSGAKVQWNVSKRVVGDAQYPQ